MARLHFNDDQGVTIACDEIDFSDHLGILGPPDAIQNEHPRVAQLASCDLLSAYAERSSVINMVCSGHTDSVRHRSAGTPEGRRPLWMDPPGVCGRCYVGSRFQLRRWIVVTPWVAMADR